MVKIRVKISVKVLVKLAIFVALIGLAVFFDNYFEKNPVGLDEFAAGQGETATEHGVIYIFSQNSPTTIKTSAQKTPDRKIFQQSHNKLLQKYHQLRNYQVFQKESGIQKPPLILTCYFIFFRSCHFPSPDSDGVPFTA